jgi:hypothetical protein
MRQLSLAVFLVLVLFAVPAWAASFTVTPICCSGWTINGQTSPTLSLVRGQTYTFDVNAPDHPFWIKTAPVIGDASAWTQGVTNNGLESGTLTFTVPASAPDTLFYQCANHSAMTGTIQITSPPSVPATGAYAAGFLALLVAGAGFVAMRRRAVA